MFIASYACLHESKDPVSQGQYRITCQSCMGNFIIIIIIIIIIILLLELTNFSYWNYVPRSVPDLR